eukprot:1394122-Amorphochlora_amoeboformis.AAC.1
MRPSNSFTLNLLKTCKRDLHDETVAQQALELATTPTNPTKSTDPATSTPESVIPSRKNAEGQGDRKETAVENTDENGFLILEAATDSIGQAGVQEEVKGGGERRIGIASDPGDKKRLGRLHKELEALQGMKSRTEAYVCNVSCTYIYPRSHIPVPGISSCYPKPIDRGDIDSESRGDRP